MRSINKSSTKPSLPRNTAARKRERSVSGLRNKMSELGVDLDPNDPNVRMIASTTFMILPGLLVGNKYLSIYLLAGSLPSICQPETQENEAGCRSQIQISLQIHVQTP